MEKRTLLILKLLLGVALGMLVVGPFIWFHGSTSHASPTEKVITLVLLAVVTLWFLMKRRTPDGERLDLDRK